MEQLLEKGELAGGFAGLRFLRACLGHVGGFAASGKPARRFVIALWRRANHCTFRAAVAPARTRASAGSIPAEALATKQKGQQSKRAAQWAAPVRLRRQIAAVVALRRFTLGSGRHQRQIRHEPERPRHRRPQDPTRHRITSFRLLNDVSGCHALRDLKSEEFEIW
jgi:hypothetical protein